jgi:hypothetical protein
MGTPIVVLSRCCSLILSQSEVNLHGDIKRIRHLSQEGTSGLHRRENHDLKAREPAGVNEI